MLFSRARARLPRTLRRWPVAPSLHYPCVGLDVYRAFVVIRMPLRPYCTPTIVISLSNVHYADTSWMLGMRFVVLVSLVPPDSCAGR